MKCKICDSKILLHNNVLEIPCKKNQEPLSYFDVSNKGMIYSKYGLVQFMDEHICEVCTDEKKLSFDNLLPFRLSLIKR